MADDPVAIPLTVWVDHPMDPDHYIRTIEVKLDTDPVPHKGIFHLTPLSGRASVAYQIRSGQGGDLGVVVECTRHGRFQARHSIRVAPGGCAVSPETAVRERTGKASIKASAANRAGEVVPVWAGLEHASHTGLVEKNGTFIPAQPPFFVERVSVFVGAERASEFLLTAAVSPDPKLRFFVRGDPGKAVRVVFVNNRGKQWEAAQRV